MRNLAPPQYRINDIYPACVTATSDPLIRSRLQAETDRVLNRCASYDFAGHLSQLYAVTGEPSPQGVFDVMVDMYEEHLVRPNGVRRNAYLGIRNSSYLQRCPLCVQRDVATLDHYLPKTVYPEFSVFPGNLIPCCLNCNKEKLDHVPDSAQTQLFHPYYDNWDNFQLLQAHVSIGRYVDVDYFIDETAAPDLIVQRAIFHFEHLKLGLLYSSHAASELESRKLKFEMDFQDGDTAGLRRELQREAASCGNEPNTWRSSLYRALANSDDFCMGGFSLI